MSVFTKVLKAGEGKKVRRLAELVPLGAAVRRRAAGTGAPPSRQASVGSKTRSAARSPDGRRTPGCRWSAAMAGRIGLP